MNRSGTRTCRKVEDMGTGAEIQRLNIPREEEKVKSLLKKWVHFEEKGEEFMSDDLLLLILYI